MLLSRPFIGRTNTQLSNRGLYRLRQLRVFAAALLTVGLSVGVISNHESLSGNDERNVTVVESAGPGKRPAVITGHVHIAKTAGTTLNAMMALVGLACESGDATVSLSFRFETTHSHLHDA